MSEMLSDTIERRLRDTGLPGLSMATIADGRLAWIMAHGVADKNTNEPLSDRHMLQACSISKFVSAIVTLRTVEAYGVHLDSDINRYLTSWKMEHHNAKEPVTLRSLLCHQAGLRDPEDSFDSLEPGDTAPTPLDILTGRTRLHPKPVVPDNLPYTEFAYSDAGYCVVEQALQDITGRSFTTLTQELLFRPLGITECRFEQPLQTTESGVLFAHGHTQGGDPIPGASPVYPYLAAAGLWCTPTAFARILQEVVRTVRGEGRLLSQQLATELLAEPGVRNIGLGSFKSGSSTEAFIFHLGWGKGFQCEFRLWPEQGDGIVVMLNANPGVEQRESLVGETIEFLRQEFCLGQ